MTKDKNKEVQIKSEPEDKPQKKCFVIMPIADHPEYEAGHFDRVYEYLIKPSCINAGYLPIRADDSKASHMIMFDILKKIMDCDMAICDLSSKNANVFYELGLRQAFNKKTILITDGREKAPFDISGFRYVAYSPSLRVDTVKIEINAISEMLLETENAPEDDVNSIVKLLKIKPAHVEPVNLNQNESIIFNLVNKLQNQVERLSTIENRKVTKPVYLNSTVTNMKPGAATSLYSLMESMPKRLHDYVYEMDGLYLGQIDQVDEEIISFFDGETLRGIENNSTNTKSIKISDINKK